MEPAADWHRNHARPTAAFLIAATPNPGAKMFLLACIARFGRNRTLNLTASQDTLAQMFGVDRTQIRRWLAELVDCELLAKGKAGRTHRYILVRGDILSPSAREKPRPKGDILSHVRSNLERGQFVPQTNRTSKTRASRAKPLVLQDARNRYRA